MNIEELTQVNPVLGKTVRTVLSAVLKEMDFKVEANGLTRGYYKSKKPLESGKHHVISMEYKPKQEFFILNDSEKSQPQEIYLVGKVEGAAVDVFDSYQTTQSTSSATEPLTSEHYIIERKHIPIILVDFVVRHFANNIGLTEDQIKGLAYQYIVDQAIFEQLTPAVKSSEPVGDSYRTNKMFSVMNNEREARKALEEHEQKQTNKT